MYSKNSLIQQPFISKGAITPVDWIKKKSKNLYYHPSLGTSALPQELTMETADSPDITIVKANGVLRGCMSST
jgi:hypothetical protein